MWLLLLVGFVEDGNWAFVLWMVEVDGGGDVTNGRNGRASFGALLVGPAVDLGRQAALEHQGTRVGMLQKRTYSMQAMI